MAVPAYPLFIDGQAVDTSDHYDLRYPFDGELVGTVARAGEAEVDAAIASAARAYAETRRMGRGRRVSA
jgi:acyl-CoA reductase-like NAD-dependent aldehyde dehydrogenase